MKYSIIIPVRSITDYLKENIQNLKKLQQADFEVIIVLDNMQEYDLGGDTRFILIESGPLSPGEKRNLGAQRATGDILAFLDDDAYPSSDWLVQADTIFQDPQVYALGGPAMTPLDAPFLERIGGRILESWAASGNTTYRHLPQAKRLISDYPSVNLLVRKEAFWNVGGFCKDFWPGEDTKLCLDLVNYYKRPFVYSPLPVVFHHRRNILLPHLKQVSRYGQHRGQFARIFPQTSRLPLYFAPSIFVLVLVFGLILALYNKSFVSFYKIFILAYLTVLLIAGRRVLIIDENPLASFVFMFGTMMTHLVYGINFIIGFIKKPKLKLKSVEDKTGNYAEG